MSDNRWARLLRWLVPASAVLALLLVAALPGPVETGLQLPGLGAGPISPSTPVTSAWGEVAAVAPGIDPDAANDCAAGRIGCLDAVIGEMEARFDKLDCDHTAPFAFTYLETTRAIRTHVAKPDFFLKPAVTSQLDAIFAGLYFDAIDNWNAGRRDEVPGAWQMAFQAAEDGRTTAAADIFLGMNAHITRDLAYAVAQMMSANTASTDAPADFLLVNEVIAAVQEPMLAGAAARFDPQLSGLESLVPPEAGVTSVELIARWRQQSFDLGLRLSLARTSDERLAVVAEIERNAVAAAVLILNTDASLPMDGAPLDRDEYCASRR